MCMFVYYCSPFNGSTIDYCIKLRWLMITLFLFLPFHLFYFRHHHESFLFVKCIIASSNILFTSPHLFARLLRLFICVYLLLYIVCHHIFNDILIVIFSHQGKLLHGKNERQHFIHFYTSYSRLYLIVPFFLFIYGFFFFFLLSSTVFIFI